MMQEGTLSIGHFTVMDGFVVSMVSWFHRFRGVDGFIFSCVVGFIGFVVSMFSWFHRFRGVKGLMVS